MRHVGYLVFGVILVGGFLALIGVASLATAPLAERWVDFLFAHFDPTAGYFGPLLCMPVLIWPTLAACYYIGRQILGKD